MTRVRTKELFPGGLWDIGDRQFHHLGGSLFQDQHGFVLHQHELIEEKEKHMARTNQKTDTKDDLGGKRKLSEMTVREAAAICQGCWQHSSLTHGGTREDVDMVVSHAQKVLKDAARCAVQAYLPPAPECKDVKWE